MSAIYGLVRLDGRPVTEAELDAMRAPMAFWGEDGGGVWRDAGAGFGQLVARRTPEDAYESGPLVVAGGTAVVVPAGRIDNRDELCRELGVPAGQRPATSDGRLMALAYERWGDHAPGWLQGDWAFAAWRPSERRLLVARDHYGHTAMYWHRAGSSLAFSSSLKGLFGLAEIPRRLDELRLAESLVICAARGEPTQYAGINRLPTGHVLTFDEAGARVRAHWDPYAIPELRLAGDDEYLERALELFSRAVRVRLRSCGPVATTLSAGLDSSAVTALAARELGGAPLAAYTARPAFREAVDERPEMLTDEWPHAQALAAAYPSVRHVAVTGADVTPLAAIERSLWVHDEPEHAAPNLPWVTALLDQAKHEGAAVLLTGQMGNGTVSWPGDRRRALERIAAGDVAGVLRALRHARAQGRGGWRGAVWRGIVVPLRALVVAERARRDPRRQPGVATSLIAPRFAERIGIVDHLRASGWDPGLARQTPRERRLSYLMPGRLPVTAWWHQRSAAHGLDVRDPTLDLPLLEFCLGTPDEQFARNGVDRWLMRRAVERLAPADVAWNRRRGAQGSDVAHRLRADTPAVSATLDQLLRTDIVREYLDADQIARHWSDVRAGAFEGAAELTRALMVGRFLLRFA